MIANLEKVVSVGAKAVATGSGHSIMVRDDGSVWSTGMNIYGQLGDGSNTDRDRFVQVIASYVRSVTAGAEHSLVLKRDWSVWATGFNMYGQLGDGSTIDSNEFVPVFNSAEAVAAGGHHSMVLKQDGSVWATGDNEYGQLGDGSSKLKSVFVEVISDGAKAVAAGNAHSIVLKHDGSVWATGDNEHGQLGDGSSQLKNSFVQVMSTGAKAIAAGPGLKFNFRRFRMPYVFKTASVSGTGVNAFWRPARSTGLTPMKALTAKGDLVIDGGAVGYVRGRLLTDPRSYHHRGEGIEQGGQSRVGLNSTTPVLRQETTAQGFNSDWVTFLARDAAQAVQGVRDPRQTSTQDPHYYLTTIHSTTPHTITILHGQRRRRRRRRRRRYRQTSGRTGSPFGRTGHPSVHQPQPPDIFNSTLGYPGEGPGITSVARETHRQSTPQPALPPPPPLPPGAVPQPPLIQLQQGQMRTQGRRSMRGKRHKRKKHWPQGAERQWRKRDRSGVWRRYMRDRSNPLPQWCEHQLRKIYPGKSVTWAREQWVTAHPKRRRTYRGGRQAREHRSRIEGARKCGSGSSVATPHSPHRDQSTTPYSCREVSTPYAAEELIARSGTPHMDERRDENDARDDGSDESEGFTPTASPYMSEQSAMDAATSLLEQMAGLQPDIRILPDVKDTSEDGSDESEGLTPTASFYMSEQSAVDAATLLLEQMAGLQPDIRILPADQGVAGFSTSRTQKGKRRIWDNQMGLKEKRNKARKRKRRRENDARTMLTRKRKAGDTVLKLTGHGSDSSRMSFTHRLKIKGVNGHVVTQIKVVHANVRTLREKRRRGMSGDMNNSSTNNNWKIPALIRMMKKHGIYVAALSETRRPTQELDIGDGYVLLTSQNNKVPWRGGVGLLLSPAAAKSWRAAGKKTWFPPSGSAASGRYLEATLATAVKSEGTFTIASLYGPTMQTEMQHREEFIDTLRARVELPRGFRRGMTSGITPKGTRRRLPSRNFLLMMGDLNARVGCLTDDDEGHLGVLGKHNFPSINSNGSMLIDMLTGCRMCVANTFFKHSDAQTATWMNAAHQIPRVIDHALIRQWSRRHIMDARAAPELKGYMDTDHTACVVTIRGNPRTARAKAKSSFWRVTGLSQKKGRLDLTPLTDLQFKISPPDEPSNAVDLMCDAMEARLDNIHDMADFDSALREIAETMFEPKPKNQTWTDVHRRAIDKAISRRVAAAKQLNQKPAGDAGARQNWRQADRALRKLTRKALAEHVRRICQEAADTTDGGKKLPRAFFQHVGRVKRFLGCYEKPAKILLRNPRKKVDEGDAFFSKRFNQVCDTIDEEEIFSIPPLNIPDVESMFEAPDATETYRAAMALNNGKSPDINGVQAEMLKAVVQRKEVLNKFHTMILSIWNGEDPFPPHWLNSLGFTIWKRKHPKENLDNWRMVNVIVITSTVISKMMHWRMQRLSAKAWSHTQYGFRADCWTMDAVFIVKRLMEAFRTTRKVRPGTEFEEYHRTLYLMFEDFVKAFDSVPRELLWRELREIYQVPDAFVTLLRKFHEGFKTYTVFNGVYNRGFTTTSGVRQGCITGPDLWNFHFQVVIWAFARRVANRPGIRAGVDITYHSDCRIRTRAECKGLTSHKGHVSDVSFADDAAIIAVGRPAACVFDDFEGAAAAAGVTMSLDNSQTGTSGKTKLLRITRGDVTWRPRDDKDEATIKARGITLSFVEEFLHLGSIHSTSRDLGVNADINRRMKKGFSAQGALDGLWKDKHVSRASKAQLVSSITLPTALYGSCNWALTRPNVRRLERFWNRITRWTYGIHAYVFQDVGKTHKQLRKKMGLGEMMMFVHRRVLVQAGHLARKPIEDPAKQLLFGHVSGRVTVQRTRAGGRTGRQTQPPKTMQRYIRQTLSEQVYPGFDLRIWQLLAQDRTWWKEMAHAATATTSFGGSNVKSLASRAAAIRKQRRRHQGMIRTTYNMDGDEIEVEVCPLRCGFVGRNMVKHISQKHPLHPVAHHCDACGFSHLMKGYVTRHVIQSHDIGEAKVKARIMSGYVYKWDNRKKYLRTYPPGTLPNDKNAEPYPEGWLGDSGEGFGDDDTPLPDEDDDDARRSVEISNVTVDTDTAVVYGWYGDDPQEASARSQRRSDILQGRDVSELSEHELRRWMRTLSYTRSDDKYMGWGPKGKLTKYKTTRHQRATQRSRTGCRRNCKWDDHVTYSARSCPLHPKYKGDKPRVDGDHPDAVEWRRQRQQLEIDKRRRESQLQQQCNIPCGYGCGELFRTRRHRNEHMRNCVHSGERSRNGCRVPGCKFEHANLPRLNRHMRKCMKTYAYTSPLCPACGVFYMNRKTNPLTGRVELCGKEATSHYSRHQKLYQRSRQVDCKSCGAPHLVPWCTQPPKEMGRQFRCSDNYFDLNMGSQRCREIRPGAVPAWKQQLTSTQDTNSDSSMVSDGGFDDEGAAEPSGMGHVGPSTTARAAQNSLGATGDDGGDIEEAYATTDSESTGSWDPLHISSDEHISSEEAPAAADVAQVDHPSISAWATRPVDNIGGGLPEEILLPNSHGSVRV